MKRRNFIKLTSTASAISLLPSQVTASLNIAKNFLDCTISNRKLVLINLAGGNGWTKYNNFPLIIMIYIQI